MILSSGSRTGKCRQKAQEFPRARGRGGGVERDANAEFLFGVMEVFWNWMVVIAHLLIDRSKATKSYTLKG